MNYQTDMKSTQRSPDYNVFMMMKSFSDNSGLVSGTDSYLPTCENNRA